MQPIRYCHAAYATNLLRSNIRISQFPSDIWRSQFLHSELINIPNCSLAVGMDLFGGTRTVAVSHRITLGNFTALTQHNWVRNASTERTHANNNNIINDYCVTANTIALLVLSSGNYAPQIASELTCKVHLLAILPFLPPPCSPLVYQHLVLTITPSIISCPAELRNFLK